MRGKVVFRISLEAPNDPHTYVIYYPLSEGEGLREAGIKVVDQIIENVVDSWATGALVFRYNIEKAMGSDAA